MSIPNNVVDKKLYKTIKDEADGRFKAPTSVYRSMWIVKTYKDRGGRYIGKKKNYTGRWLKEEWVQVIPYIKRGEKIVCGENEHSKACRPLKRVNKQTPPTMKEVVKMWGEEKVLKLARQKNRDMDGRLNWKRGVFKKST